MAEKQLFFSVQYKCNKGLGLLGLPELLSGNKNKNMDVTALQNVKKVEIESNKDYHEHKIP